MTTRGNAEIGYVRAVSICAAAIGDGLAGSILSSVSLFYSSSLVLRFHVGRSLSLSSSLSTE